MNSDWEVNFNPDVTGLIQYPSTVVDSGAKVSELLCDLQRTASTNMIAGTGYMDHTATLREL